MATKPSEYDTSKETLEEVLGISLTEDQFLDLAVINMNMQTEENPVPVHHVLLILKTLGLIGDKGSPFAGNDIIDRFGKKKT